MRFDLWQNDLEPPIAGDLRGAQVPLPDGATVVFTMTQADGSKRVSATAVIDDPGSLTPSPMPPVVHYAWATGDTSVPGVYRANWKLVLPGSAPETFPDDEPIFVVIRPAL